jgi:hypothetical protein
VYVPADAYQDHVDRKAHPFNAEHVDYRSPSGPANATEPACSPRPTITRNSRRPRPSSGWPCCWTARITLAYAAEKAATRYGSASTPA